MSHKKKAHQQKIAELKKIRADLSAAGQNTDLFDKALKERDFDAPGRTIRYFRDLFQRSNQGGSYRENFMNKSENESAGRFLKDTQSYE